MISRPCYFKPGRGHRVTLVLVGIAFEWWVTRKGARLERRAVGKFTRWTDGYRALKPWRSDVPVRPTVTTAGDVTARPLAAMGPWAKLYPNLVPWLCDPIFDDGAGRRSCYLTISARDGEVHIRFREPNLGLLLDVSAADPAEALVALNGLLGDKVVPWRHDPEWSPPRKNGRRKRP